MKKRTKQDVLDSYRRIFFLIGLILALGAVLMAFEWKTYEKNKSMFDPRAVIILDEDMTKITKHEEPEKPKPKIEPVSVLKEVENDVEVEDIELFNPEADQTDSIPEYVYEEIEEEDGVTEDLPFIWAEEMPEFPGGEEALYKYLADNSKFTDMAREAQIQGVVYVEFVVEKDGSVSNVQLKRGIGGGLDEIALEVVRNMPNWSPGKQRSVPVRVAMVLPFRFKLN